MAITKKIEPQIFTSVYNEIVLVLDSDKKTETNFQYLVDINVDSVFKSRLKVSSNPDGFAVIDLHKHVEPFITFNIDHDNTTLFQTMPDSFKEYDVTLSESYVDILSFTAVTNNAGFAQYSSTTEHRFVVGDEVNVSGSTDSSYNGLQTITSANTFSLTTDKTFSATASGTTFLSDGSSSIFSSATSFSATTYAVNSVLDWKDVPEWDFTVHQLTTATTGSFLSTLPSTSNDIFLTDRFWSNFFFDVDNSARFLEVISNNGTFRIGNGLNTASEANRFQTVGLGPWNLNNTTSPVTVLSGALPIIDSATTQYTATLINSSNFAATSETFIFNMKPNPCNKYEEFRMIYLDSFGSFLNVTFSLVHNSNVNVARKTYKSNFGNYNSTTNIWGYNSFDRGKKHLDSQVTESFTITSDWINESTGNQIIDLIKSPEVYHLDESGVLLAVNILTNSIRVKQRVVDRTINYTIRFEHSFNNSIQRG
ncbi:MAG: hypothetical protein IIC67_08245 [Thaumarchaeota archaeon]|nr:hypothetical protein [Nitrososphaerota archaeon]